MNTDTTFITNQNDITLQQRFKVLIKDTRLFDVLVGYFYPSGFHAIYESLEKAEKIRILVGIGTNKQTYDLVQAHFVTGLLWPIVNNRKYLYFRGPLDMKWVFCMG
jgi:hypothetical protein